MKEGLKDSPRLGVVGAGRLGRTIMATWPEKVVAVGTRNRAVLSPEFRDRASDPSSILSVSQVDLLWLAVPDDHIHSVSCEIVSRMGGQGPDAVIHSSGAQGVQPLSPFFEMGVLTGALHPNLIIDGTGRFPERAVWGFTGEDSLLETCTELLERVRPDIVKIAEEDRTGYHAAATLAANYPLLLIESAERLYRHAGLAEKDARSVVASYVHQILEALASGDERGTLELLTGPVVRGDERTLDRHIEAVRENLGGMEADLLALLIEVARHRLEALDGHDRTNSRR